MKVRFGHYDDDEAAGDDTIPSNFQPLGKPNSNALSDVNVDPDDNFTGTTSASLTTTNSSFFVSDFGGGAGSGSTTVSYSIAGHTGNAPTLVTTNTYLNITVGAPDSSGNGTITINSNMACTPMGQSYSGQTFTIQHPNDTSVGLTYTGNLTADQCPITQTKYHTFVNLNVMLAGSITWIDAGGTQQTANLAGGASRTECAVVGSASASSNIGITVGNTCV